MHRSVRMSAHCDTDQASTVELQGGAEVQRWAGQDNVAQSRKGVKYTLRVCLLSRAVLWS